MPCMCAGPPILHRQVAVKQTLDYVPEEDWEKIDRYFRQEADLLERAPASRIPRVSDRFMCSGIPYIAMDFVEGESLDRVLRDYKNLSGGAMPLVVRCGMLFRSARCWPICTI